MKKVPLSEVKDDAEKEEVPLENDPRFLKRIEQARQSLRAGRGTRVEDLD